MAHTHNPGCQCYVCQEANFAAASLLEFPAESTHSSTFFGFKWGESNIRGTDGGTIHYSILDTSDNSNPNVDRDVLDNFEADQILAIRQAFHDWAEFANIDFVEVDDASVSEMHVSIGYTWSYGGFANWTLAGGGRAGSAEVVVSSYDADELYGLMLHEVGHAIGVAHTQEYSVMQFNLGPGVLTGSDYGLVWDLYGQEDQAEGTARGVDWQEYLSSNPDLVEAGITTEAEAIDHFIASGGAEGRTIAFDETLYLEANPDLVEAGITEETAAAHYQNFGKAEGRLVDVRTYLELNPDLQALYYTRAEGSIHYRDFGKA